MKAQANSRGLTHQPRSHVPHHRNATCFSAEDMSKISTGLKELKVCRELLKNAQAFIETRQLKAPVQWWQEPTVVVSGVVISLSLGAYAGYIVGKYVK